MKRVYSNDFSRCLGDEIQEFFYMRDIQYTDNGQGNKWQKCVFSDKTGIRTGKAWSQYMNPAWNAYRGSIVQITGRVELFRDIYELSITGIRQAEAREYDSQDFERSIVEDERQLLIERFQNLVHGVSSYAYRSLLMRAYGNQARFTRLCELPAEWKHHHAYRGGWLEHTVDVTELALYLSDVCHSMRKRMFQTYVEVDKDLLVTGALLHDIGRLSTLNAGIEPRTTQRGYLVGAVNDSLVSISALNNLLPKEERVQDLTKLLHVVAGALGEGGNIPPQTLEALLLSDAKHAVIRANTYYSMFSDYDYEHLDSKREMVFSGYFGRQMMRGGW